MTHACIDACDEAQILVAVPACCLEEAATSAFECSGCGSRLDLASLQIVRGTDAGTLFPLRALSYVLGRSRRSDLVLRDASVSREHARIVFQDGRFVVEDCHSTHSLYLDEKRTRRGTLTDGCSIQLGSVTLRFTVLRPVEPGSGERTADSVELPWKKGTGETAREADLQAHALAMETLDRLRLGVVLVGKDGSVSFVSRAARSILDEDDGLSLGPFGLRSTDDLAAGRLRKLLPGPAGSASEPGGLVMVERSASRRPLSVLVTPLEPSPPGLPGPRAARAVFISDPEKVAGTSEEILKRLYGLTPAETGLVRELLQGRCVDEAAATLGVSVHTARSHLKRVFSKTSTRRQSELVLLLLSGPGQLLR